MSDNVVAEFKDKEVKDFLKHLDSRLKDVKDGTKKYGGILSSVVFADVISHFENELGSGGPWKSWTKAYKDKMAKIGKGGNKILQDTGKLRQNFKPQDFKSVKNGILWFNDAHTKSGFPYASAHDKGGGSLPKRDFMWLSGDGIDKISELTLQFMLDEGI